MKCPICDVDLRMTERAGIEIDYCPQCRGVWLDRGELDKIISGSSRTACADFDEEDDLARQGVPPEFARSRQEEEEMRRGRRHRSFWGQLFDFD